MCAVVLAGVERRSVIQMMDLRQRPRRVRVPVHTDSVHAAVMSQLIVLEEKQRVSTKSTKRQDKAAREGKSLARS